MFLYLSILAFAYAIYPRIPSARGGGAYTDGIPVQISFETLPSNDAAKTMAAAESPFIILYQNSESIFVASKTEAGGPEKWQEPDSAKPRVYELRRQRLSGITYMNPTPTPTPP